MFKHTRRVTLAVARTLTVASLAVVPLLITNACSNDSERALVNVEATGRLQLSLTGISNTNQVYQLRNATFSITGTATGTSVEVNTETQPSTSSLLVELPPDSYEVLLSPGFYLERLPAGLPIQARRGSMRGTAPSKSSARDVVGAIAPGVDSSAPTPPEPTPGATRVDATLISSNPGVVIIQPNVVSPLEFTFQVGGDIVETGNGVLDIGIAIVDDGGQCAPDEFEPNDDPESPTPITPGAPISASLCELDVDNYIFPSPVPAGETFAAVLGFQTARGDIDAVLIEADTGFIAGFGGGVIDNEVIFVTSTGGDYILQTLLFADPDGGGNTYTVDIGDFENPAENSCCEPSELPGCDDGQVLTCVCAVDSFCCEVAFDPICVGLALQCGGSCSNAGAESDCCSASAAPGCTDRAVHDCVCAIDFACCSSGFDDLCVAQAISECGAQCTLPPPASDF